MVAAVEASNTGRILRMPTDSVKAQSPFRDPVVIAGRRTTCAALTHPAQREQCGPEQNATGDGLPERFRVRGDGVEPALTMAQGY